ncbi:MAG TPA: amino acid adenylation domain-containing protein, partial [Pilimelia sp.]|nr:amino acid adenylation domain-containing protein [Pilimelia sp.]
VPVPSHAHPADAVPPAPAPRSDPPPAPSADPPPHRQALLDRRLASLGVAAGAAIPRLPRTGAAQRFPCSSGQQRMWLAAQFDPADASFHVAVPLRLAGPLDVDALRQALRDLVRRHEILRTGYVDVDGEPWQVVHPGGTVPFTVVDLRDRPAGEREQRARDLARAAFAEPFDLAAGVVLRAALYRLADDDHVLLLTTHHIAIDGWSIGTVLTELATRYAHRSAAEPAPPPLPELPIQYADYAAWEHRALAGGGLAAGLAYWRAQLAPPRARAELPITRRRPPVDGRTGGGKHPLTLPPELLDGLRRAARAGRGTTPFVLLTTAYKALLARYTGQRDVTVGTLLAARTHVETEPLVGYFANPVALRTPLGPELTFADAVARVRGTVIDAFAHQSVPFDRVVRELAPRREAAGQPLFQSAVLLHHYQHEPARWPGLDVRWWDSQLDDALFDLTLVAVPTGDGGLAATLSYRRELFDPADIARFAAHFRQLLGEVVAVPDRPLGDAPLLTPAERQRILVDAQGPVRRLPEPATFAVLFGRTLARTPDAVAVADARESLTYRELDARAARLAGVLRSRGVGAESPVGICLDRSAGLLVAVLAIWRAGGAYVPLDPAFPPERLRMMLADAGVGVLVTEEAVRRRLPGLCADVATVVDLHRPDGAAGDRPGGEAGDRPGAEAGTEAGDHAGAAPAGPPTGDRLAYVIYTSGSTGRPKGVEVTHAAVTNLLLAFQDRLGLTAADRLLAVTTLSFDISVLELLLPLVSGGTVVVAADTEVGDGAALAARARASGATVLQATPATWRLLLAAGGVPDRVRHRLCGGEAFPRDLAEALRPAGPDGGALWNVYGPTETTVWSAAGPVPPGDGPVAIGPPLDNTRVYLLDGRGQPVPVGVVGEVHIGGAGLARGYRGRPALTAQRFLPDPFGTEPGARCYATGDLARYLPDGRLEFLGRADHQVKIRGFRVELGEIEVALRAHDQVGDAVVTAWRDGDDGDARLVAYVTGGPPGLDAAGLWSRLRPDLAARLPAYLVPATLVLLDALPRTPNGKLDRAALPPPTWGATDGVPYLAPRTPVERAIVGVWEDVLGVRPIGVESDFFALGGHSLLAARVLARLRTYFRMEAPTRVLFEAPTVAGMAAALVELEPVPGQVRAVAELREEIDAMSAEDVARLLAQEDGA